MRSSSLTSSTRRGSVLALLVSMMLLGACGSVTVEASTSTDKDGGTTTTTIADDDTTTTTVADDDDTTTTTVADDDDTTTTTVANDDGSNPNSKFCKVAIEADTAMNEAFGSDMSEGDLAAGLESFQKVFEDLADILDDMYKAAPAEIKSDMKIVRDAFAELYDEIKDAKSFEDLSEMDGSAIETDEAQDASDRVGDYLEDVCGIDTTN